MVIAAMFSGLLTTAILWVSLWFNLSYLPKKEKQYVEIYRKILYLQTYNSNEAVCDDRQAKKVVKNFMRELRILVHRGCIKSADAEELKNWIKGVPEQDILTGHILKIFEKIKMQKEIIED